MGLHYGERPLVFGAGEGLKFGRRGQTADTFDLYVDWKNGNDANPGTLAQPLKTLSHCLSAHAANGNKIGILGSNAAAEIYYESGLTTALTNLTIKAVPGHTPVFSPSTAYTTWAKTGGATNVYQAAYTPTTCYSVWNGATALTSKASVAACDAAPNSFYFDNPNDLLYVNIGGAAPTSINAVPSTNALLSSMGAGITYDGLTVQWCHRGLRLSVAGTIKNCAVQYHSDYLGDRPMYDVTATSGTCNITNSTASGTYGAATGSVGVWQVGACALVVTGCTIHGASYGYYQSNAGGTLTITNTTFYNCDDCITVAATTNAAAATISYCTAYEFGHGAYQFTGAAVTGTIHHCVAYAPSVPVLTHVNGFICEAGASGQFYHNVAVGATIAGYTVQSSAVATVNNCAAINCITGGAVGLRQIAPSTLTADYNGVYNNATNYGVWPAGAHDVATDPLMAGLPSDVHVGVGSPYLDAGTYIAGVSEYGPPTDIGRWES